MSLAQGSSSKLTIEAEVKQNREVMPPHMKDVPHMKDAKVIGIYGIPGSGKSTLLSELRHGLDTERFSFYEGSEVIAGMIPGGIAAFQKLNEQSKRGSRERAIQSVYNDCRKSGKTAIVTGHFMFWCEPDSTGSVVCTEGDLATYTHIIYLNIDPNIIEQRCSNDTAKHRQPTSVAHLHKWQQAELDALRPLCREHNILFSVFDAHQISPEFFETLILDFEHHDEGYNNNYAEEKLDQAVSSHLSQADTVMVIDGDKTLTSQDTGKLFWEALASQRGEEVEFPLKTLFSSALGYSYAAFRQAALLHEEIADETYETVCQQVASAVIIHKEFLSLLYCVERLAPIGAIIVSCGLRRVWEIVLERAKLRKAVEIIAGGRVADGMVVTAIAKAKIVTRLQDYHQKRVWAFGDSPLDLEMLRVAEHAVVVVTDTHTRSKSMESALSDAIDHEALRALQVLIPGSTPPRLDTERLPIADITKVDFVNALLDGRRRPGEPSIFIATDAAKLLATPMRDAAIQGPRLRKAHKQAGWYLALEFLPRIVGVEACTISHVLGRPASGSRLVGEEQTTILALMRGGDPMASGVSEAFPLAMYVHLKGPQDLKFHHLDGQAQVILVDSVVNTGKSVIECVQAVRHLHPSIRIIIVAGVIQAQCLYKSSALYKTLSEYGRIDIVTLRVSDTKFTGSGTTDTGNRLFNTTHLY